MLSETHFEVSNGKEIIRAIKSIRIRDLDPSDDERIKQTLRYVFTLIGLRPESIPDEIQKAVLIDFIRSDLKNYGLDEIKIAFKKAIKGDLQIDPNHYQNFSPMYLAQIMKAYEEDRRLALRDFRRKEIEDEKNKKKPMTESERKKIHEDWILHGILNPWKFYLKSGSLTFGITPFKFTYESLVKDLKLIDLSDDEKRLIYDQAKSEIEIEIDRKKAGSLEEHRRIKSIKDLIEKDGIEVAMKNQIQSKCYEISVRQFYEKAKREGIDLEEKINQYLTEYKQTKIEEK